MPPVILSGSLPPVLNSPSPMVPQDLEYRLVESAEREQWIGDIASRINGWCTPSASLERWKADRELRKQPDATVIVTPEGYGKSTLVAHLIAKGFKVVFCAKSNAQLLGKEEDIAGWGKNADITRILGKDSVCVARYESKAAHLQAELALLDIKPGTFRLPLYEKASPYDIATVNEAEAIKQLAALFAQRGLAVDAEEFFIEHYSNFHAEEIDGASVDVVLLTFAKFQFCCQSKRGWWRELGLVKRGEKIRVVRDGEERSIWGRRPLQRVAVIIDDPDRADVDWLRRISAKTAQKLIQKRLNKPKGDDTDKDPRIVKYRDSYFEERPQDQILGEGFMPAGERSRFRPKLVVTTTETQTADYALHTLRRRGLNTEAKTDVFRTPYCNVTAIQTTITRKKDHVILLLISELLKEEFPQENVTLIADGLGGEFNLSNSKGRNDLIDRTTIIKLSWPHPSVIVTAKAHRADLAPPKAHHIDLATAKARLANPATTKAPRVDRAEFERMTGPIPDADEHDDIDLVVLRGEFSSDELVTVLLGDVANQALGRNQGFRFQDREAILLIDPRWHDKIMHHQVLRYRLTPWSSELPSLKKRTSGKSVWDTLAFHGDKPSKFQKRLIELLHKPEKFGMSADAKRLAQKLPVKLQAAYQDWLEKKQEELAKLEDGRADKRQRNTEAVRLHRARKKAASEGGSSTP